MEDSKLHYLYCMIWRNLVSKPIKQFEKFGLGFNRLKVVSFISMIKIVQAVPKTFKDDELQHFLDEHSAQTLQELPNSVVVDESTVSRSWKEGWERSKRMEEGGVRSTIRIDWKCHFKKKRRAFYGLLWLTMNNGSTTTIPSSKSHGSVEESRSRRHRSWMSIKFCCAYGGANKT